MLTDELIDRLAEVAGGEHVLTDEVSRACYAYDATNRPHMPEAVVRVATPEEVSRVLILANARGFPVYPRGAGTGYTGGSVPEAGGVALSLERMNHILSVDEDNLTATVQSGVVTSDLHAAVEERGLFYPPDPASMATCTIGGNIAENAGGPRCVKYGVTREYVMQLEVVLPTGEVIRTGAKTRKSVAGYDLTRLFVGSEGTLGVVTEATLRLLPKPACARTALALFSSMDDAARAVSTIIRERIIPATLEFMDRTSIDCVREHAGLDLPESVGALLIIEVDGDESLVGAQIERISRLVAEQGSALSVTVASDEADRERLWLARRSISAALMRISPTKINEDIVVPISRVPDMVRRVRELAEEFDVPIVTFGHAGDGNLHVNVMVDKRDEDAMARGHGAVEKIFRATLEMGGSVSGEHGIGIAKVKYLPWETGPTALEVMSRIKSALDPAGILNPGKVISVHESIGA